LSDLASAEAYQTQFDGFLSNLALDATRVGRIEGALAHLRSFVASDPLLIRRRPTVFVQGSYGQRLAVRPADPSAEYDVDVVIEINGSLSTSSSKMLDWLHDRLATDAIFAPRLVEHARCARIQYQGEFHLDIVPGRRLYVGGQFRGRVIVPDRESRWRPSYPRGFARWCDKRNELSGGDFARMVMMLKRWRDLHQTDSTRVRSIVFSTLIGQVVPPWRQPGNSTRPDATVLYETLVRLERYLNGRNLKPIVRNPSLLSENLARSWTQAQFQGFRDLVAETLDQVEGIVEAREPDRWRLVFGEAFPTRR
jgi:hypothetical protein